jgi:hypothetical protein
MRTRRSVLAAIVPIVMPLASLAALPTAPAGAHSGGRAQLYVDSVRLEPQAEGWLTTLVVRDADSGRPEPGFGVELTASDPAGQTVGPVSLADPDANGRYTAVVPMTEGGWALTVEADEIPGGARAVPFKKTWPITLRAGQPLDLAGSRPPASEGEAGATDRTIPLLFGVAAAIALSTLVTLTRTRRQRKAADPPPPDRASATATRPA